jgi:hypothetical protein
MDATGLMAREGRSASAALTAGLSITWQQQEAASNIRQLLQAAHELLLHASAMPFVTCCSNINEYN